MASSQIEIVSSMPFGRVLKHHNHHDSFITHAAFNESIKNFVKDHLNTSSFDSSPSHHTNKKSFNDGDTTWVSRVAKNNFGTLSFIRKNCINNNIVEDSSVPALVSPRHSRIIDRWAAGHAQETPENHHQDSKKVLLDHPVGSSSFNASREVSPSSSVEEISNLGASSLVQIWEKRLNHFSNCTTATPSPKRSGNEIVSPHVKRCIRGRHAFNDMLMQQERERYGELNNLAERCAVSNFTQRSRIQSLIRLRLLQRGVAVFDQSYLKPATTKVNSQPQGSEIMQPREEFTTEVDEHKSPSLEEVSDRRKPHDDTANSITESDNSDIINQLNKETMVQAIAINEEESESPSSNVRFEGACFEAQRDVDVPNEIITTSSSTIVDSNANEIVKEVNASHDQQYITTETGYSDISDMENSSNQQYEESNYYENAEEEEAYDQDYYDESSCYYDWMSPISRPRSYWEELRQSWYREILDFGSDNEEIRNLLQRRTVSTFLSSEFRDMMDRLMECRIESSQTNLTSDEDDVEYRLESKNNHSAAYFHEQLNFECNNIASEVGRDKREREEEEEKAKERMNEEQQEGEENAEEQEEESITTNDSDCETDDCCSQSTPTDTYSPSTDLLRTWSYQDNEVAYESSQQQPPQSQESFYRQDSSSSSNQHSIEMECIYELRGQIDQIFQEMSELRKSLKICMDMQMQLQQLKNQEAYTVKEEETPKRGKCRICNGEKVSAVLYRCGHMCMCFKCANELQRKGEKCPICKSPIIDVVQVHDDI